MVHHSGGLEKGNSLPLELCGITLLLSIVMLLTRSRLLYSFLYFAGIGGAFIALLTPNLVYPFPHFRFLLFFAAHGGIILASLYMTWIEGYKPTWKSLFFTMLCLNIAAAAVYAADRILGANYMFLAHKPGTFSVLDYFGPYPYYLLVEEAFAFVVFLLMYLVFFWLPQRLNARKNKP
uniref:YwaF family protein n=1 Tax=Paenibacillus sonchi TaxID=373687 RepID=UPI001F16CCDE|nr:TIGR02206 family membrane protein [Paenibacillus sonchi]